MGRNAVTAVLAAAVGYTIINQHKTNLSKDVTKKKRGNDKWKALAESDWIARQQSGFVYEGVTAWELEVLQDPRYVPQGLHALKPDKSRLSIDEGYRVLDKILLATPGPTRTKAYARLQAAWAVSTKKSTPDLFIKAFNDLSIVLFGGLLHRRVYIAWQDLSSQSCAGKCRSPSKRFDGIPRVTILLCKTMIGARHKSYIWGTLLHEMLHAWLNIVAKRHRGYTTDHGAAFKEAAGKLVARLKFPGLLARHIA